MYAIYGDVQTIWVGFFVWGGERREICKNGYIFESVLVGLTEFIRKLHKMVKNCQNLHGVNGILRQLKHIDKNRKISPKSIRQKSV